MEKGTQWEAAPGLPHSMLHQLLPLDVVSRNATISACKKQWGEALGLLHEMVHQLTPNVVSYNAAITACEIGELWEGALVLLQEMGHQLLTPDVLGWNSAISACEKGK